MSTIIIALTFQGGDEFNVFQANKAFSSLSKMVKNY